MSAIHDLHLNLCNRLNEMYAEMMADVQHIRNYEKDWWLRDHKISVRRARYTLETSDLECQRWAIVKNLALAELVKPIVITGPMA